VLTKCLVALVFRKIEFCSSLASSLDIGEGSTYG
jgi:hypothetical protein